MMPDETLKLHVLKVVQPIGEFFVASISARDLVAISYSDVRRMVDEQRDVEKYLGIQRPIDQKRIKQIKKYIAGRDATFPTAVIVAVDERCAEYEPKDGSQGTLTLKAYAPDDDSDEAAIPFKKIAKVIDGQHRIAAFLDETHNYAFEFAKGRFDINLAIFVGADVAEQANIFATVNLAQTKVNRSLVYDLTELAKTPSPQKTCHNVAVALDGEASSPLYRRIKRLGTATPGREYEPLTQAGFVEALLSFISTDPVIDRNQLLEGKKLKKVEGDELQKTPFRNLFIDGKEVDIAEIVFNYFSAIKKKWPASWDATKGSTNLLPRSNAFKAFMKYLRLDVYPKLAMSDFGRIPEIREFGPFFSDITITDEDFNTKNFVPGSGGESRFLKMLRGQITLDDMVEPG
jgi:DGQHR domain-containing protein